MDSPTKVRFRQIKMDEQHRDFKLYKLLHECDATLAERTKSGIAREKIREVNEIIEEILFLEDYLRTANTHKVGV